MSLLAGLNVIELANERSFFAGKLLADMGANVILVEPPQGDPSRSYPPYYKDVPDPNQSLYFWHYNTSKKGITLDLDSTQGQQHLAALLTTADILIESEAITRLANLGCDYPTIREQNEKLIHVAITPYGRQQPLSDHPTTDLTLMAAGGPTWSCGYDDHELPPVRGWGNQAYHTGCHFAVMSILTALLHRGNTGRGQFIDVSITAALNVTTEAGSYAWLVNQSTVQRQTGRHAAPAPTGDTQTLCADGHYANTGVPPRFPKEFARLLSWLQSLGLVDEFPEAVFLEMGATWEGPFDLTQIGVDDTVTAIFSAGREGLQRVARSLSAQEFFVGCQNHGLTVGPINAPEEAFEDAHFKSHGMQVPLYHDLETTVTYPGAPFTLPTSPWRLSSRAPHLGEHNDEILSALG